MLQGNFPGLNEVDRCHIGVGGQSPDAKYVIEAPSLQELCKAEQQSSSDVEGQVRKQPPTCDRRHDVIPDARQPGLISLRGEDVYFVPER
jgi:hypothetical protein